MFESEYSQDNYKSLKISIGTIIKKSEMLRFVPDTLKLKRSKNAVTKLPFRTKQVPDQYKTQEICTKLF